MISIVDYNAGNLVNVVNAFSFLGEACEIINSPEKIKAASRLVLPGVGAFGFAMAELKSRGLDSAIYHYISENRPFLGICLGYQLLFESSEESPEVKGLGVFEGTVSRLKPAGQALKIPHVGWNNLKILQPHSLFNGITDRDFFYFVHSFCVQAKNRALPAAVTDYGGFFDSAIGLNNIFGVQFHPEKSGDAGMKMLNNFISL